MRSSPKHRRDILLVSFACLGIAGVLIHSSYLVVRAFQSFTPGDTQGLAPNLLGALGMLFCAVLLVPMLILNLRSLNGQPDRPAILRPIKSRQLVGLLLAWVCTLILGSLVSGLPGLAWAGAGILMLPGISLPILILFWIASGGLPGGSVRRLWSVYGISMIGSTLVAVLVEYLSLGAALVIVEILASANPGLLALLNQIKGQVNASNAGDIQTLVTTLAPYLSNPLVILSILLFAAVLGPLVEEALKPAVVWLLGKRLRSPSEGFLLGALCGAGFATLEGLLAASGSSQLWGFGQVGRAAASLMHITASGILGWGIASARLEKRYLRLGLSYLLAVCIHGLWNGSAVLAIYGSLRVVTQQAQVDLLGGMFVFIGLAFLLVLLVSTGTALPLINHRLRRSARPEIPQNYKPLPHANLESRPPEQSDIIFPPKP